MTLLNPEDRTNLGRQQMAKLLGKPENDPVTLYEASWRDFVFAEVWSRPALEVRARYLISIAGIAESGVPSERLDDYVRGALVNKELTQLELREAALHCAVYNGWSAGSVIDDAVTRMLEELGIEAESFEPICAQPWDPSRRHEEGAANFKDTMTFGAPPPFTPYFDAGILSFVFGEMWNRPGLCQRSRRWLTLVGVSNSSSQVPIETHIYAAMASGNTTAEEMQEFVLQYAIHAGWPRASVIQGVVIEMAKRVENNLDWQGSDNKESEKK